MLGFIRVVTLERARVMLEKYWRPKQRTAVVPLERAANRMLASSVASRFDLPPFDRAKFDGYAVHAADTFTAGEETPVKLTCIGSIHAGEWPRLRVGKRRCVEIATGAPMPKGADAVVMLEHAGADEREVHVYRAVAPGENVAKRGSELRHGEKVFSAGQKLTSRTIGTLSALGVAKVEIYAAPRVAVISSGSELVEPASKLGRGQIYDVNGPALSQAVHDCGGDPEYLGIVADEPRRIASKIKKALAPCDLVVISGGSSAGAGDIVSSIVDKLGKPGVIVHGLAMKPGKPAFIGVVRGKPIFGLPGYPVSALMIFDQLVAPYIWRLAGLPQLRRTITRARLATKIISARGRRELVPVKIIRKKREMVAEPLFKDSGAITALSLADGYIDVPLEREIVEEGEVVEVILFGGDEVG